MFCAARLFCACGSSGGCGVRGRGLTAWERGVGKGREGVESVDIDYALCLRLQRGCGVRGWGRDDQERGRGEGTRGRGGR